MQRRCLAILVPFALALPSAAIGQTADSVSFRKGQWGVEFGISSGFAALGALRFIGPSRAVLVDMQVGYSHTTSEQPSTAGSGDNLDLRLRVGTRSYHAIGPRLFRLLTIGVSANRRWQQYSSQDTVRSTSDAFGAGVFGDLGATWLVTPNLALGAKWGISLDYTHAESRGQSGSGSIDDFRFSAGSVALIGQLYF